MNAEKPLDCQLGSGTCTSRPGALLGDVNVLVFAENKTVL